MTFVILLRPINHGQVLVDSVNVLEMSEVVVIDPDGRFFGSQDHNGKMIVIIFGEETETAKENDGELVLETVHYNHVKPEIE